MARRTLKRMVAGLVLGALALTSTGALADERTEARAHFKKGMSEIADGRYDTGIEELKKAYDILPHPNVLYNIARAYVDEGDLENAVAYYKKYLEGNPKDRDEVAQIVAALEARVRKQQAELFEAQQAQTNPGAGTGPGPGTTPGGGTTPGTGPGTGPGAGTTPGGAIGTGPGAGKPGKPEPALPAGELKTGDGAAVSAHKEGATAG